MSEQATQGSATMSPTALVEAHIDGWNARDGDAVAASLAPGGTYVDSSLPEPVSGDALAGYVSALATAFPDFRFDTNFYICESAAFIRWTMTGTYLGTLPDVPGPTGAAFELQGVTHLSLGPEGITSCAVFFNQLDQMRQLGLDVQLSIAE